MKSSKKKNKIVLLFGISAFFLMAAAMISPAAAQNVTGIYDADGANYVVPSETYIAYNFTYNETSYMSKTNLTWFNITEWNVTATGWTDNNANFDDIDNVSLWNFTDGSLIGNASKSDIQDGFWINISLGNYTVTTGTNIYVNITLNDTGLIDGKQIAFDASLSYISNATGTVEYPKTEWANDTVAETINVLNATAGTSNSSAGPGETFVHVGNVTVDPGNNTNAVNLTAITFNATLANTNLTATEIDHFALWNDTNANTVLDVGTDEMLWNTSATEINATFTGLNSTIPAGANNRYFLTMNLSASITSDKEYQAFVDAQNITISNGTGPLKPPGISHCYKLTQHHQ